MPKSRPDPAWKIALWAAPICAVVFIVFGGFRTGYPLRSILLLGAAGLTFGAMLVPEVEPLSVRRPALWQMACGSTGGLLMAAFLDASPLGFFAGALIGMALGFLAPYWMKYVNI